MSAIVNRNSHVYMQLHSEQKSKITALSIGNLSLSLKQLKTQYPSGKIAGAYLQNKILHSTARYLTGRQTSWTCVDNIFRWPADSQNASDNKQQDKNHVCATN